MRLDPQATAHLGTLRDTPATGAEPQRDALLSAHLGFLSIVTDDDLIDDEVFCVVLKDDEDFPIKVTDDEVFCVVLVDDDEVRIK